MFEYQEKDFKLIFEERAKPNQVLTIFAATY